MRIDADTNVWSRDRTVDGEGGRGGGITGQLQVQVWVWVWVSRGIDKVDVLMNVEIKLCQN